MAKKIWEIDVASRTISCQDAAVEYQYLGGRGLTSSLVAKEVDPTCHPLGSRNIIVIAPGLLAGTGITSSGRLSVGAKSPLTGGIKESNAGGTVGYKLGRLDVKALQVRGRPDRSAGMFGIRVNRDGIVSLEAASLLRVGTIPHPRLPPRPRKERRSLG